MDTTPLFTEVNLHYKQVERTLRILAQFSNIEVPWVVNAVTDKHFTITIPYSGYNYNIVASFSSPADEHDWLCLLNRETEEGMMNRRYIGNSRVRRMEAVIEPYVGKILKGQVLCSDCSDGRNAHIRLVQELAHVYRYNPKICEKLEAKARELAA